MVDQEEESKKRSTAWLKQREITGGCTERRGCALQRRRLRSVTTSHCLQRIHWVCTGDDKSGACVHASVPTPALWKPSLGTWINSGRFLLC